jgi:hypothetical protein
MGRKSGFRSECNTRIPDWSQSAISCEAALV